MKVLFLDHDGVVCLSNNWGSRLKKQKKWGGRKLSMTLSEVPVQYRFDNFDKKAVKVLNEVLTETGAEIVVSSDWKLHGSLEDLQTMYKEYGVIKSPIDLTPELRFFDPNTASLFGYKGWLERARCLEIQKWLELNEVESWVAVDDLNMSDEFLNPGLTNFVLTPKENEGIKQTGIKEKLIKFLNQ